MVEDKLLAQSRERFDSYLRAKKKRRTVERFAILENVMATTRHFTIESFQQMMEDSGMHVATATLYSTLELLVDCGLVQRHRFGSSSAYYEKVSGVSSHHHLICTVCGRIKEVRDPEIATLLRAKRMPGFSASYFSLNIYGRCSKCQRKSRKSSKNQK